MMRCIALTGISNHVINDLKSRLLRTIEIRSPHNFSSVLHIDVGDLVFVTSTSPNDVTAGTTGLIARLQRRDISIHRVVQSNDFLHEEREAMMARVQLVAEGSGRVQRIIQSELGSALVADVEDRPVYAAQ
ncbi:MAG: DUF473 domain-containing protein [Euryarchaeota archaeon]|nr:DUF473 domain-containing protein [Euryarchaeota archaeon]